MFHINRPIIYDYPETNEVVSDKSMETIGKLIQECFKEQIQYMFADYLPELFGKIISHLSKKIPEGIERKTNFLPSKIMVWPALGPPAKRATMSYFGVKTSTPFPLPSSPNTIPNKASTFPFFIGLYFVL